MIHDKNDNTAKKETDEKFNVEGFDPSSIVNALTDKECLVLLAAIFADRVRTGVAYLRDPETSLITHSIITLRTDEDQIWGEPDELEKPFLVAEDEIIVAYKKDKNDKKTIH